MWINPGIWPRASRLNSHIILIGMMGSGKTTVGRELSHLTQLPFMDTDQALEKQLGKTVAQIFETEGEAAWRTYEATLCQSMREIPPHIIATGGGIVLTPENGRILREIGTVFWLQASLDTHLQRLALDTDRPLLPSQNKAEKLIALSKARQPLYQACAHHIIQTDGLAPAQIATQILATQKGS